MKNYLNRSLWITLTILAVLLLLYFLPVMGWADFTTKHVDMLSDIRKVDTQKDSIILPPLKVVYKDSVRTDMTCIKDYSDSSEWGMSKFYRALDQNNKRHRPIRIAVFGDSFIEADILTADLREMLQDKFGGCGVGFLTINAMTGAYRPTVHHKASGFVGYQALKEGFDRTKEGISGHYFEPAPGAYVYLRGRNDYASHLDSCQCSSIYFLNKGGNVRIGVNVNDGPEQEFTAVASPVMQQLHVSGRIGSVRWTVKQPSSSIFYGVSMDGNEGVTVDNFSLRGNSGFSLRGIPAETLKAFNSQRPYDLIILQYGLNVTTTFAKNFDWYVRGFVRSINHLKRCFPNAGILLLGVGDRDYRSDNGDFRTMPGIKVLLRYQENMAADQGIAFWNMFEAMGGDESMSRMVHARPSEANYDYTHINYQGGKHIARLLYKAMMWGKKEYDRKQEFMRKQEDNRRQKNEDKKTTR